jgi:hypothetical protein
MIKIGLITLSRAQFSFKIKTFINWLGIYLSQKVVSFCLIKKKCFILSRKYLSVSICLKLLFETK